MVEKIVYCTFSGIAVVLALRRGDASKTTSAVILSLRDKNK